MGECFPKFGSNRFSFHLLLKCKTNICSATILPDVLSRFENWSLTLTEKRGKGSIETRILKKAFEPNKRK